MSLALVPLLGTLAPSLALALLVGVVFAETGLLVGFFLPGDSLLFAAGLFTAAGVLPVPVLLVIAAVWAAAVAGDQVAFLIGRRAGARLLRRRSRLWSPRHLHAAERFFARYGAKAIILARFVPLARTFTPVVAGAAKMSHRRFTTYNVLGGLLWSAGMILAGFYLGGIRFVATHIELTTLTLIAVSLIPALVAAVRARRGRTSHTTEPTDPQPVTAEPVGPMPTDGAPVDRTDAGQVACRDTTAV